MATYRENPKHKRGVQEADLSNASVDAATVWGPAHGPAILLNTLSGRDAPWAPPEIERRANAFAAELLLPRAGMIRVLGEKWRVGWLTGGDRSDLMDEFGVGDTVCGHQLENRLGITTDLDD